MINLNLPPTILHSLTHPDAAENARSVRPAGRPDRAHWFAYWSSARPRGTSAQKGTGLRTWASKSMTSLRADAKKSEALPNVGFPRELSAPRDC
jgi:hypothetical protein